MCRSDMENDESATYFTREALAIRKLLEVLHRESLHCERDEITEYLASLRYNQINNSLTCYCTILYLQWNLIEKIFVP